MFKLIKLLAEKASEIYQDGSLNVKSLIFVVAFVLIIVYFVFFSDSNLIESIVRKELLDIPRQIDMLDASDFIR